MTGGSQCGPPSEPLKPLVLLPEGTEAAFTAPADTTMEVVPRS